MGNALRLMLVKHEKVEFAGYTIPHPLLPTMHLRVVSKGAPALEVTIEAANNLNAMCAHILAAFEVAASRGRR